MTHITRPYTCVAAAMLLLLAACARPAPPLASVTTFADHATHLVTSTATPFVTRFGRAVTTPAAARRRARAAVVPRNTSL
jgi:hypothetical protein